MDAAQIVYLKQQGVSDTVINTMLNQPRQTAPAAQQPASPAASSRTATVVAQPTVTYVQTVPSSTVYVIPDTQTYQYYNNYYPAYGYYPYYSGWYYPAVTFSFGFGGGYHGGYYHGGWGGRGYHGGYHGLPRWRRLASLTRGKELNRRRQAQRVGVSEPRGVRTPALPK